MGKRQRIWARKVRDKIIITLGSVCIQCGETKNLEFDVIIPIGNLDKSGKEKHHRHMDWSWRMSFYRKQLDKNNLQLLCDKCNSRKQNQLELTSNPEVIEPF